MKAKNCFYQIFAVFSTYVYTYVKIYMEWRVLGAEGSCLDLCEHKKLHLAQWPGVLVFHVYFCNF